MGQRPVLLLCGAMIACFGAGWLAGKESRPTTTEAASPSTQAPAPRSAQATANPDEQVFNNRVQPFLNKYCVDCHKGEKPKAGLSLDVYQSEAHARKDRKNWGSVQHALTANDMPPKEKPQPTKEERQFIIQWIENTLTKVDCTGPKDPGRVTIRRLNRAEYNNTIRDLCGVDFKPAEEFPTDDVGYGFDNIGDVLSFQPVLLEKYMTAADKILSTAIKIPETPKSDKQTFRPQQITTIPRSAKTRTNEMGRQIDRIIFNTEGSAALPQNHNFTADGEYILRFRGWGTSVGDDFPKVVVRVDGRDVKSFTVDAERAKPQTYEVKAKFPAGEKRVAVAFTNAFEDKEEKISREFGLETIEVEGPINAVAPPIPESTKLLLIAMPTGPRNSATAAEKVLSNFARRAYRRPVKVEELDRLMKLYELATRQGESFEHAIKLPMKAVLVSPHFLYRIEDDPKNPNEVRTLNDFEFATRLSYFLWSTMPDEELFRLAEKNELRQPAVLEAQVKRMLKDPRSKALSENFAGQWLQLRMLRTLTPDAGYYPAWDENLKSAVIREAELYFEHVVQNDRNIMEFLDSNYTFVNGRLARHYGIPDITGIDFQKVKLADGRRGGVVTMASTLTVTSNPTRTSPVKRGKWILENVLGTPPPPPVPDAGELPPTAELKGTLRQQMEQHRADPKCAVCHAKLDPLGFGLENFDGIGGWRAQDNKLPIDSSGILPGGEKFSGPAELKQVLMSKAEMFRRCFAEKLLIFGLGRGLEYYDKCALDEIVSACKTRGDSFSGLVLAIVQSDPFQKRKGKRSE